MEQQDSNGDVLITASYDDYQAFLSSLVWHDIQTELGTQKTMIEDALAVAHDIVEVYRLQGRLEACKDFISMPTDLVKLLEERFAQALPQDIHEDIGNETTSDAYYEQLLEKYKGE